MHGCMYVWSYWMFLRPFFEEKKTKGRLVLILIYINKKMSIGHAQLRVYTQLDIVAADETYAPVSKCDNIPSFFAGSQ